MNRRSFLAMLGVSPAMAIPLSAIPASHLAPGSAITVTVTAEVDDDGVLRAACALAEEQVKRSLATYDRALPSRIDRYARSTIG